MARIDTLKFTIDGKEYESNVNVGKDGIFKTSIHWQVLKALNISGMNLESKSKDDLVRPILSAYREYLEAKRTFELYISIQYKASGQFTYYKDGAAMFGHHNREYYESGYERVLNKLHFGFEVYCKETNSLGAEIWHQTRKTPEAYKEDEKPILDDYYIGSMTHSVSGKLIPYTAQAIETLEKANEGLRGISEMIFTFINQDEAQILAQLNRGNLLSPAPTKIEE